MRTASGLHIFFAAFAVSAICALASCSGTRMAGTGSFTALYDYESYLLHPEFRLYHISQDSSRLYYRIRESDLLYVRQDGSNRPEAKLQFAIEVTSTGGVPSDSTRFAESDIQREDGAGFLLGQHDFSLKRGEWTIRIKVSDLNRNVSQEFILNTDKVNPSAAHHFLVLKKRDGTPLFSSFCAPGDTLLIESQFNFGPLAPGDIRLGLTHIEDPVRLPPPPFSGNNPEHPTPLHSIHTFIQVEKEAHELIAGEGLLFLTTDPDWKRGISIIPSTPFFPEIKNYNQLVGPLRYITSKSEYDELARSSFPKPLVDQFWIGCGSSKDRARELIRTYYGRVEEANRYFSGYTEGWRTDRGMIHLIFGNPSRIRREASSETWIYGEEGHPSSLHFLFRKVNSPLSDNVYVLQRDPMFRQSWEQMVTAWRQGRVFSD